MLIEKKTCHIIHEYNKKPKQVHVKLMTKYSHLIKMPSLMQIQNYIRYRRTLIGHNNNIEHFKNSIQEFFYKGGLTPENELFSRKSFSFWFY